MRPAGLLAGWLGLGGLGLEVLAGALLGMPVAGAGADVGAGAAGSAGCEVPYCWACCVLGGEGGSVPWCAVACAADGSCL
jgi:hypothetical protein